MEIILCIGKLLHSSREFDCCCVLECSTKILQIYGKKVTVSFSSVNLDSAFYSENKPLPFKIIFYYFPIQKVLVSENEIFN